MKINFKNDLLVQWSRTCNENVMQVDCCHSVGFFSVVNVYCLYRPNQLKATKYAYLSFWKYHYHVIRKREMIVKALKHETLFFLKLKTVFRSNLDKI